VAAVPTPKDRFTSLDTLALVREVRSLGRARVDKAYDVTGGGWSLSFRVPGEGRRELALVPGRYAALTAGEPDRPDELSPFARELRRLLAGAVLLGAAEPAGERFLELRFQRSDDPDPITVALEMFGKGNLVVAKGTTIVAVAEARRFAHRQVRVGAEYSRPPVRLDPWKTGPAELEAELARSRTDLASTLAARLSYGGPVAEELIARAGLDGASPAATEPGAVAPRLHRVVAELLQEVGDRPHGRLYRRDGTLVDATPYASRRWAGASGVTEESVPTFSEAAEAYFRSLVIVPPSPQEVEATRRRRELERLREQQEAAIRQLAASVAELRSGGESILTRYADAEAALERARAQGTDEPRVDVELDGRTVSLRKDRSARESAQELFAEAKRLQAKLAGARAALVETESLQARPDRGVGPRPDRAPSEPARSHKAFWFEKFRWFVSSDGVVVIGGRDAASNDLMVRRNLKEGDIYVHADLHGAASVVVKHPAPGEPPATEATLREAGQWAVAFSKAWRAGLASASAFWVNHDQVSKSATSGEFVAKGAWAIHGTKHVLRDLPTELGIGTIDYRGDILWTCAPPSALRARGTLRVVLVPGEERTRTAVEVELSRELGMDRSRLQALLPAGGITVRRE
jgi:predicted ribosome quality control (RQC) complex YloA/Tae2 family protein